MFAKNKSSSTEKIYSDIECHCWNRMCRRVRAWTFGRGLKNTTWVITKLFPPSPEKRHLLLQTKWNDCLYKGLSLGRENDKWYEMCVKPHEVNQLGEGFSSFRPKKNQNQTKQYQNNPPKKEKHMEKFWHLLNFVTLSGILQQILCYI